MSIKLTEFTESAKWWLPVAGEGRKGAWSNCLTWAEGRRHLICAVNALNSPELCAGKGRGKCYPVCLLVSVWNVFSRFDWHTCVSLKHEVAFAPAKSHVLPPTSQTTIISSHGHWPPQCFRKRTLRRGIFRQTGGHGGAFCCDLCFKTEEEARAKPGFGRQCEQCVNPSIHKAHHICSLPEGTGQQTLALLVGAQQCSPGILYKH